MHHGIASAGMQAHAMSCSHLLSHGRAGDVACTHGDRMGKWAEVACSWCGIGGLDGGQMQAGTCGCRVLQAHAFRRMLSDVTLNRRVLQEHAFRRMLSAVGVET